MEAWVREHVEPAGPLEPASDEPWATVWRVPLAAGGSAWLKACAPVQAFEVRLSAALAVRWPGRVAEVLAADADRAWLLLADAGTAIGVYGNPPEPWLQVLPAYAELQRGEAAHAEEHVAAGVPDLRLAVLPDRLEELLRRDDLPLEPAEAEQLRRRAGRFPQLCGELAAHGIPETIQHDDLHMANVYDGDGGLRVLDWGDSSVAHPFFSLGVTFEFLDEVTRLPAGDPWYDRLRDAYLEPWGPGHEGTCALAQRVGAVAHACAWLRQRDNLPPARLPGFDEHYRFQLRRAIDALGA